MALLGIKKNQNNTDDTEVTESSPPSYAPKYGSYMRTRRYQSNMVEGVGDFMHAKAVDQSRQNWMVGTGQLLTAEDRPFTEDGTPMIKPITVEPAVVTFEEALMKLAEYETAMTFRPDRSPIETIAQLGFVHFRTFAEGEGDFIFDELGMPVKRDGAGTIPFVQSNAFIRTEDFDNAERNTEKRAGMSVMELNKAEIIAPSVTVPLNCKALADLYVAKVNARFMVDIAKANVDFKAFDNISFWLSELPRNIAVGEDYEFSDPSSKITLRERRLPEAKKENTEYGKKTFYYFNKIEKGAYRLDHAYAWVKKIEEEKEVDVQPLVDFLHQCDYDFHVYMAHQLRDENHDDGTLYALEQVRQAGAVIGVSEDELKAVEESVMTFKGQPEYPIPAVDQFIKQYDALKKAAEDDLRNRNKPREEEKLLPIEQEKQKSEILSTKVRSIMKDLGF